VEDCALVLNAIHGPDGRDGTVLPAPFDWNPKRPLSELRVGVLHKEFERLTGDRKKLYDNALAALQKAGVKLENVETPAFDAPSLRFVLVAEAAAAFDDITRSNDVAKLKGQQPGDWPNTFRMSRLLPAVEYIRAQRARTLLMRQWDEFMSKWDVLVSTPGATLLPTNLTGHPQVVVPCGFLNNMPEGLLFTGRLYEEGTPLRVALAYEQATEWRTRRPAMNWA
jgi:Asp-tRNA(Asn)/Glu-tRNA(Gln) amidotransferase A subunit family amidase